MKRFMRLAAALLAAIGASAPLVAAPAASWVNFGGGITNGSTTTHYGSTVNTATVTGGTWNAEGGYLQLGDATTETDGTITLQLPATITSATAITVMLDVADLPTGAASLITVALSGSKPSACLETTSAGLQQVTGGTTYGSYAYDSASRSPRQMIAFTYNSGVGTNTIIDGVQQITNTSLKYRDQTPTSVTIGAVRGLKVYGIYLYASQLSAGQVATEMATVRSNIAPALSVSMTRNGAANDNSIKVATLRQGATSTVADFTATFGSSVENAKAARNSANTSETATFFKGSWSSCANVNVKDGYPMVCNKFTNADSRYYWRLWVPIELASGDAFNEVLPELYPTTSSGGDQSAAATFFNYTISLYEGTVNESTASPTPLATATGTTSSTKGLNTTRATLSAAISGRSGVHTLKIEVTPNTCGGGAYSGIRSVHFFNRTEASRTVSGKEGTWSTGWTGDAPVYGADVTLTVSDAATLSMDTSATLSSLTVNDGPTEEVTPSLTFTGTNSLSSATTTLNANTNVSAITASLGAVTLASGKTLTVGGKGAFTSLAGTGGILALDATKGSISYTNTETELEALRTYRGKVVFKGTKANAETSTAATGVTLPYDINKGTMSAKFAFDGGTHSFQYGANSQTSFFGPQGTDNEPTLDILDGTTLNFCMKDLSGWVSSENSEKVIVRVREGSTLNFTQYNTNTAYFNNRLVLDNNATVNIQNTAGKFCMNGGVRAETTAQLAMLGGETPTVASVTGSKITLASDSEAGVGVSVGKKATLTIENNIEGGSDRTFAKYGAGTLVLSGAFADSPITVNDGVLGFSVESGERTVGVNISGAGTVKKLGAGSLSLTGAVSAPVTVAAGTLQVGSAVSSAVTLENGAALDFGTGRFFALASVTMGTDNTIKVKRLAGETVTTVAGTGLTSLDGVTVSVTNSDGTAMSDAVVALVDGTLTIRSASGTPTWTLNADGTTGSWNGELTGWPADGTVIIDAMAVKTDTTVALPASGTFTELIVMGSSAKTTLTVGQNTTTTIATLSTSGYVAMAASDVNYRGINAVTVAGGIFEVTTDSTETLGKAISGAGKFAKGGSGTLTLGANISTEGGSIVQSGTLQFSSSGTITTSTQPGNYTSNAMGDVRVCEDAVLDVNGQPDLWLRTITLETRATYKNSGSGVGDGKRQLRAIVLEGDAKVVSDSSFGIVASGFKAAMLDLGGHTLTKEGTGSFWLTACTISNGTLEVKGGIFVGNSQATACAISGEVTLKRAANAVDGAKFVFTQGTTEASALSVQEGATLKTEGPSVAAGIDLGYLILTGGLVANSDLLIAHLKTAAAKTLNGTGTVTVKAMTLDDALTVQQPLVFDRSAAATTNVANAVKVLSGGSLTTKGNITFGSNACEFSGPLTVESGTTTWRHNGANKSIDGNITVNVGATFATASDFKYHTTLNGSLSGVGTIRAKVATYSSQDDGTRYLYCNGKCDDFIGSLAVEVSTTTESHSAPRRTNLVLKPGDGKFGGSLAVQLVTVSSADDTTLSTDVAADATVADGVLAYAKAYITGNASIRGAVDKNLTLEIGTTEEGAPSASATTLAGTLGTVSGEGEADKSIFSAPITVASGSSLTITSTTPATLTGAVSGGDSLTIGDGTTATQVTLTGTLGTVTDGVAASAVPMDIAANATLTLASATPTTLTGAVTGSGKLVIGNETAATAVTLAATGNGTDITVAEKASLNVETGAPPETIVNETPKSIADGKTVTNDGTLTLTSGYGYFNIAGTGKTVVPGSNFLFGIGDANGDAPFSNGLEIPASANFRIRPWSTASSRTIVATGTAVVNGSMTKDGGSDGVTATLQVAANTTLSGSSTFSIPVTFANDTTAKMDSNATFTFSSALTVPKNVRLPGTITLGSGAVLSGAGELSGTVTLSSGVIIDATKSTPSNFLGLTGTVAPVDTLKVKVASLTNILDLPTTAGLTLEKVQLTDSTLPTDAKLLISSASGYDTLKLFVPPTTPTAPAETPRDAGVDAAIAKAAEESASAALPKIISEVTAITGTGSNGTGTRNVDGASLFENVLKLTPGSVKDDGTYTATATVAYDFGVSAMTVKSARLGNDTEAQLYVVLCAKVSNGTDSGDGAAAYGTKTTVSLLLGDKVCDGTEGNGPAATELTDDQLTAMKLTRGAGEKWFAVPMSTLGIGTHAFKVKALQKTPAEN